MSGKGERSGAWTGLGAVAAAGLASVCCLGPLVLAGLGLGGLGLAAGLARYRPGFLAVTAVLLAVAFWQTYRRREVACADGSCQVRSGSGTMKGVLWGITVGVVALAAYPWYAGVLAGRAGGTDAEPAGERIALTVTGMTCAACATHIAEALEHVPGVLTAVVSLEKGEAVVVAEPGKAALPALLKAVESAGPYRARAESRKAS